jgi:hypothetical protein
VSLKRSYSTCIDHQIKDTPVVVVVVATKAARISSRVAAAVVAGKSSSRVRFLLSDLCALTYANEDRKGCFGCLQRTVNCVADFGTSF